MLITDSITSGFNKSSPLETLDFVCLGSAGPGKGEASDEDDDNEFFDAMEEAPEFITVPADPQFHKSVHSHPPKTQKQTNTHTFFYSVGATIQSMNCPALKVYLFKPLPQVR